MGQLLFKKKKKSSFLQSFPLLTGLYVKRCSLWTRAKLKLSEDLLPAKSRETWGRHHQNSNDAALKAFSSSLWRKCLPASWNQKKRCRVFKGLVWTSSSQELQYQQRGLLRDLRGAQNPGMQLLCSSPRLEVTWEWTWESSWCSTLVDITED